MLKVDTKLIVPAPCESLVVKALEPLVTLAVGAEVPGVSLRFCVIQQRPSAILVMV